MKNANELILELHLILIYITGWVENSRSTPDDIVFKAWKCFLHEVLDELNAKKLILHHPHSQLVILTEEGERMAQELLSKYFPQFESNKKQTKSKDSPVFY